MQKLGVSLETYFSLNVHCSPSLLSNRTFQLWSLAPGPSLFLVVLVFKNFSHLLDLNLSKLLEVKTQAHTHMHAINPVMM